MSRLSRSLALFGAGFIILGGCVSSSPTQAEDPVANVVPSTTDTSRDLAPDIITSSPSTSMLPSGLSRAYEESEPVNVLDTLIRFDTEVQPILENKCVSCHSPSGVGANKLMLDKAGTASEFAEHIAFVVGIGYMPPWFASKNGVPLVNDWSLTDKERTTLIRWSEEQAGALSVSPDTPLIDRTTMAPVGSYGTVLWPGSRQFEADLTIRPRDGAYSSYVDAAGQPLRKDDYRCQVYEIGDTENDGTWIAGFSFAPETAAVHHVVVYLAPPNAAPEVMHRLNTDDLLETEQNLSDQPGYTCYGMSGLRSEGVKVVHTWAPGTPPLTYPEGYGVYVEQGSSLIVQFHYHYNDTTILDASALVLDVASPEESTTMLPMQERAYLTPAEVPCTSTELTIAIDREATIEGYVNLCERENVLEEIGQKFDAFATVIPDLLIQQCGGTVDDYDDLAGTIGHSQCDLWVRSAGTIHTIWPHMHEFGTGYRLTLNPGTPRERILVELDSWDFEWQLFYEPIEDIQVKTDEVFRIECWWDRSLQPMSEPRYILWNQGTDDEMCYTSIWTVPDHN